MIPFEEISDEKDRSWSFRLFNILKSASPEDDMEKVINTIGSLDDFRLLSPLTNLLEDSQAPGPIRSLASRALCRMTTNETQKDRQRWWNSGDSNLQRHAVSMAEREEMDLVESIAKDPNHNFHFEAIEKLDMGSFEEKRFQDLRIKALKHTDNRVRIAAAKGLLWDEPIAAADGLLLAATDPDDDVAEAALDTLCWYRSQKCFLALLKMAYECSTSRKENYLKVAGYIRKEFIDAYKYAISSEKEYLKNWMNPVWDLLNSEEEEEDCHCEVTQSQSSTDTVPLTHTASQLMSMFDDSDGCWIEKYDTLRLTRWNRYSKKERKQLIKFFTKHPDIETRNEFCKALSLWDEGEQLLDLLDDPSFGIRKSAAYWIGKVSKDAKIAARLWKLLEINHSACTHAREILDSYLVHAHDSSLNETLLHLATDERETIRTRSIYELDKRDASSEIATLSLCWQRNP